MFISSDINMDKYITLKEQVLELLRTKLPEDLYYHGADHTLKAMDVAEEYIEHHKLGVHEAQILRLAVLLHDVPENGPSSNFNHRFGSGSTFFTDPCSKSTCQKYCIQVFMR